MLPMFSENAKDLLRKLLQRDVRFYSLT